MTTWPELELAAELRAVADRSRAIAASRPLTPQERQSLVRLRAAVAELRAAVVAETTTDQGELVRSLLGPSGGSRA